MNATSRNSSFQPQLKIEGISKTYGKQKAVNDVTLEIRSGETVGLFGPNGSGKTTIFEALIGFTRPDSGRIWFEGQDITAFPTSARVRLGLGYLPQEAAIFRGLTVSQNLQVALEARPDLSGGQRKAELERLIEEYGLKGISSKQGSSLSGGMRRRVEIIRVLAVKPKVLIFDEPFVGLDPVAVDGIQALMRDLVEEGYSIVLTDHKVREALSMCNRVYFISSGELQLEGSVEDILSSEAVKRQYLGLNFDL